MRIRYLFAGINMLILIALGRLVYQWHGWTGIAVGTGFIVIILVLYILDERDPSRKGRSSEAEQPNDFHFPW